MLLLLLTLSIQLFAAPDIDNGLHPKVGDYPGTVKISTISNHDFFGIQELNSCTGSLISPKVVITAAHCVNLNSRNYSVVSEARDEKGKTVVNGKVVGTKVLNAYMHPQYQEARKKYVEANEIRMGRRFIEMTPLQREEHDKKIIELSLIMSKFDLAILELEKARPLRKEHLVTISCDRDLRIGERVEFAGFGRSRVQGSLNSNTNYVLLYGMNVITDKLPGLYISNRENSNHQINGGDSGGPLFLSGDSSTLHGISVLRMDGEKSTDQKSIFVNLSSKSSRDFFKKLSLHKETPKEIKESIQNCAR